MKALFSSTVLLTALSIFSTSINAEVVYSYAGAADMQRPVAQPCDSVSVENPVCPEPIWESYGTMSASFSVTDTLAANLEYASIETLSWSMSNGTVTADSASDDYALSCADTVSISGEVRGPCGAFSDSNRLLISTDANGNITDWIFGVGTNTPINDLGFDDLLGMKTLSGYQYEMTTTFPEPYTYLVDVPGSDNYTFIEVPILYPELGVSTLKIGSASAGTIGTWTATVVPVPAAAWLFISALGLLGLRRKR